MAISEYLARVRRGIGHDLLLTPGTAAVIPDDHGRILLHKLAEGGKWSLPGGGVDPGEVPAETVIRETFEETGLKVRIERLLGVYAGAANMRWTYPNGDAIEVVSSVFQCSVIGGELSTSGDETVELGWHHLDSLPELSPQYPVELLKHRGPDGWFQHTDVEVDV